MAATLKTTGAAMPRPSQLLLGMHYTKTVSFDEERARTVFREVGDRYRMGVGFFSGVRRIQPQHLYTPAELKELGGLELANWFFFLSISQRGGLNSDDSIRLTRAVWDRRPDLFNPPQAAALSPREIRRAILGVAAEFYPKISGATGGGSLSFKLREFARHWRLNAAALDAHWGGDVRNVFTEPRTFEEYFLLIDRGSQKPPKQNPRGFYGMRRKIFSLLIFWLIEFELVSYFRIPLVVDFHVLRALIQLGVLQVNWKPLGRGNPKIEARLRPRALRQYPAVHVHETLINQVIGWSCDFLIRENLSPFDVGNGLWNLSRVLCASYYGNKSESVRRFDPEARKWHNVTAKLVNSAKLNRVSAWPKNYRDLCRYCPFERYCGLAIPAGPYYDWGQNVNAGEHVVYPGREATLGGIPWYDLPINLTRRRNNTVWDGRLPKATVIGKKTREKNLPTDQLTLTTRRGRCLVR